MTPFKESDHDDLYDHKTIITMNMRVWMKNVFHYNVYAAYRTQKTQDIMVKDDYFRMSYHSRTLPFLSYCVWKIFIYCGFGLISNLNRWNLKITSTCYQNQTRQHTTHCCQAVALSGPVQRALQDHWQSGGSPKGQKSQSQDLISWDDWFPQRRQAWTFHLETKSQCVVCPWKCNSGRWGKPRCWRGSGRTRNTKLSAAIGREVGWECTLEGSLYTNYLQCQDCDQWNQAHSSAGHFGASFPKKMFSIKWLMFPCLHWLFDVSWTFEVHPRFILNKTKEAKSVGSCLGQQNTNV